MVHVGSRVCIKCESGGGSSKSTAPLTPVELPTANGQGENSLGELQPEIKVPGQVDGFAVGLVTQPYKIFSYSSASNIEAWVDS